MKRLATFAGAITLFAAGIAAEAEFDLTTYLSGQQPAALHAYSAFMTNHRLGQFSVDTRMTILQEQIATLPEERRLDLATVYTPFSDSTRLRAVNRLGSDLTLPAHQRQATEAALYRLAQDDIDAAARLCEPYE